VILDTDTTTSPALLVATERLLWVGPLTVLTSIVAVLTVRLLVIRIPGVRSDSVALGWIAPTADTTILCSLAVIVFAVISAFDDNPLRKFQQIALGALLVSFLPLLIVGSGGLLGNGPTAIALGAMHIAAYVPCVTLLPRLTAVRTTRRAV
jgi:hypothetical protein